MKKLYIVCATLLSALPMVALMVTSTGCKQEQPLQKENEVIKTQIIVVGIDSTSGARTEDKVLFVNVK